MEGENQTCAWEIFLLGLTEDSEMKPVLFGLFLSMYLVTVLGNLLIILAVTSDPHLHTPMYFFLCNLALADIGFCSTTIPNMLANIQTHNRSITYAGCLTQVSFFFLFGCLDSQLLAVMAYDRLVAICHPLHYTVIMHPRFCVLLSLVSLSISLLESQLHFWVVSQLTSCRVVEIPHFFCDASQLLILAGSDCSKSEIFIYIIGIIFGAVHISVILYSYKRIVSSVLSISSKGGKSRAFSTCGTHLSVVCLFYGTGLGTYFSSAASHSFRTSAVVSLMYTIVNPMLNPFIYSLRNRDIKWALWRIFNRRVKVQ